MTGWLMLVGSIALNAIGNLLVKTFSAGSEIRGVGDYLSLPFALGSPRSDLAWLYIAAR